MKVAVTGSKGQLGTEVTAELKRRGFEIAEIDLPQVDITNEAEVRDCFLKASPDAVIHLAAYTAVDRAEEEKDFCYAVNVTGTEHIARICGELDIPVLFTSTDYVFDVSGTDFFETGSRIAPCNYYGQTKALAEDVIKKYCKKFFIVRISWVFGPHGKNFVFTMLNLAKTKDEISVVCDQKGSPTYAPDVAALIADMIVSEKYGTYHATNEGVCSWAEFAREIMKLSGSNAIIKDIPSAVYPTAAVRPLNSRLSKASLDKAGFERLPDWKNALERFFRN